MTIVVILAKIYYVINQNYFNLTTETQEYILLITISMIYLFSYKKQTKYITKRINANN